MSSSKNSYFINMYPTVNEESDLPPPYMPTTTKSTPSAPPTPVVVNNTTNVNVSSGVTGIRQRRIQSCCEFLWEMIFLWSVVLYSICQLLMFVVSTVTVIIYFGHATGSSRFHIPLIGDYGYYTTYVVRGVDYGTVTGHWLLGLLIAVYFMIVLCSVNGEQWCLLLPALVIVALNGLTAIAFAYRTPFVTVGWLEKIWFLLAFIGHMVFMGKRRRN